MPAILSREESRVDFGIAKDTLIVSPSLAPASSNSSFGIITAMEFPTLLIFPVNTRDIALLLRNNYISMALHELLLASIIGNISNLEIFEFERYSVATMCFHRGLANTCKTIPFSRKKWADGLALRISAHGSLPVRSCFAVVCHITSRLV